MKGTNMMKKKSVVVTFAIIQSDRMKEKIKKWKKISDTIEVKTKIEEKKKFFYA